MTTIKEAAKSQNVKREVRQLRQAAHKASATREAALRFLAATGLHTASGQLKPQFR